MSDSTHEDRRHFQRIPLERNATLHIGSENHHCEVADVSLKGVLLIPTKPGCTGSKGDKVTLDILLDTLGDTTIHMQGEIAHVEGNHLGIQCHQLDLDSATQLRRLVELNLADPDLLERELGAMIDAA